MAVISPQQATYPSFTPTFAAASAGGDTCKPADNSRLIVKNASGASITVTVSSFPDTTPWGTAAPDLAVAVPAGQERWIGPLRGPAHADPTTGDVSISYSAAASVTVGLIAF